MAKVTGYKTRTPYRQPSGKEFFTIISVLSVTRNGNTSQPVSASLPDYPALRYAKSILISTQLTDNPVNHGRAEDVVFLESGTLFFQTIGRSDTTVGQLSQLFQFVFVFFLVDIYVHISLIRNFQSIRHLKTAAASYCQSCNQLVQIG